MAEARGRRDEVADAVRQGYIEAKVAAGQLKGRTDRPWKQVPDVGLTGAALEAWVDGMAARFPGQVH